MIVLDSSAIVAILWGEPEAEAFLLAIADATERLTSAFTYFETLVVTSRRARADTTRDLDAFVTRIHAELVPFDERQISFSREAFLRFGKGHHPAALNLGDCVSYALAKSLDAPLLFKGDDFALTDVRSAIA